MKKQFITTAICLSAIGAVHAQIKIKDGTVASSGVAPNANAVLELESSNKGMLMPRVALTSTISFAPLAAHVAGMLVFNTAMAGAPPNNVVPGIYINDGTKWVQMTMTSASPSLMGSCKEIKTNYPSSTDGVYWIDPDYANVALPAMQVYCDMTTNGGGWTLIAKNGSGGWSGSSTATVLSPNTAGWLSRNVVIAISLLSTSVRLQSGASAASFANQVISSSSAAIQALQSPSTSCNTGSWGTGVSWTVTSGSWNWTQGFYDCFNQNGWPHMFNAYMSGSGTGGTCVQWYVDTQNNRVSSDAWSTTWVK